MEVQARGRALSTAELRALEEAATGDGVHPIVLTARSGIETVLDYVTRGNTAQIGDPAFVKELRTWIRFSDTEAVPRWLGSLVLGAVLTPRSENDRCAAQLRSSAGVIVFASDVDDHAHWIEAGRCYERFALQATALGIRNAFLNQPVEVAALRSQFAAWLEVGTRRPDLVVRFGRGPAMPRSPRRPLDQVLT